MGKIMQRAGGGKVTVEGLAAGKVKAGETVTIKQGSKVVQSVTGNYAFPAGSGKIVLLITAKGVIVPGGGGFGEAKIRYYDSKYISASGTTGTAIAAGIYYCISVTEYGMGATSSGTYSKGASFYMSTPGPYGQSGTYQTYTGALAVSYIPLT